MPKDSTYYIKNAKISLFRFEGLQDYSAEDGTALIDKLLKTGETGFAIDDKWWNMMKELNSNGVKTERVRLIRKPINNYTKWEVEFLKEASEFSGDLVYIIEQERYDELSDELIDDFWLIDEEIGFIYEYEKGRWINEERINEQKLNYYISIKNRLLEYSGLI